MLKNVILNLVWLQLNISLSRDVWPFSTQCFSKITARPQCLNLCVTDPKSSFHPRKCSLAIHGQAFVQIPANAKRSSRLRPASLISENKFKSSLLHTVQPLPLSSYHSLQSLPPTQHNTPKVAVRSFWPVIFLRISPGCMKLPPQGKNVYPLTGFASVELIHAAVYRSRNQRQRHGKP